MTVFERIYREAASTFSKREGHGEPLSPYSRTWATVIGRAEHALWMWNEKYGPLSPAQRDYAVHLICDSLKKAREGATAGDHYAFFHQRLTTLLNHETVHEGFRRRGATYESVAELDAILDAA